MDCQIFNYVKLASTDTHPEVYRLGDELKALIEPQTPLIDETSYAQSYNYTKLDSTDTDPEVYKMGDDMEALIESESPLVDETSYAQSYNYTKLDSMNTDPTVYKMGDDLKILIDHQTPLVNESIYAYNTPKKFVTKAKKKKRVLSTLDILISIFIVTPCVVGCWRGIWQIMDIYAVYFPPWESFIIGMATYVVLALGQDVFHHVVVENEPTNAVVKVFSLFLMKFYITTFNVICNMIWRAGWILFDRYCGLKLSESGSALAEGSSSAIWFTIVCALLLFCMKGLKNTMSPPFSIALDCKDEVFLFSTRYIYKGTYCAITVFAKQTPENKLQTAEKLVSSQSMKRENAQVQPPSPFGLKILGPRPQEFTPTTSTSTPTTMKAPSMNYPQLAYYRNNHHPKNIQDILGYISKQRSYDTEANENSKERLATNQGFKANSNSSSNSINNDPFSAYKPTDPSEVNLLATASFRFAPPVWKNFRKLYQQQPIRQTQQVETSNIQETIRNFAKPFVVTLNIFPMDDQYPAAMTRYGQRVAAQRLQGELPYRYHGDPRGRFLSERGHKINVKLNVFPESMAPFLEQDERAEESNANKVKFV